MTSAQDPKSFPWPQQCHCVLPREGKSGGMGRRVSSEARWPGAVVLDLAKRPEIKRNTWEATPEIQQYSCRAGVEAKSTEPPVGIEPTTIRLRSACSAS